MRTAETKKRQCGHACHATHYYIGARWTNVSPLPHENRGQKLMNTDHIGSSIESRRCENRDPALLQDSINRSNESQTRYPRNLRAWICVLLHSIQSFGRVEVHHVLLLLLLLHGKVGNQVTQQRTLGLALDSLTNDMYANPSNRGTCSTESPNCRGCGVLLHRMISASSTCSGG